MAERRVDPLEYRARIVGPDGTPSQYFMRVWNATHTSVNDLSALLGISIVAGTGLSGGGSLGDLADITVSLNQEFVQDLVGAMLADSSNVTLTYDDPGATITADLTDTAVTPGTYGDDTHVAQITVDAKGRITAVTDVEITGSGGSSGSGVTVSCANSPTFTGSSSSFAWKGIIIQPTTDIVVSALLAELGTGPSSLSALIATASSFTSTTPTISAAPTFAPTITPTIPGSPRGGSWMRVPFTSPITLTAGITYVLMVGRVDGTGTTALPINGNSSVFPPAGPWGNGYIARRAALTPASGDTIDTNSGGVVVPGIGLEWSYTSGGGGGSGLTADEILRLIDIGTE